MSKFYVIICASDASGHEVVSCNHGRYDDRADNNPILRTVALTTFAAHRHSQPIISFSVQLEATTGRFLRHVLPSFRSDYRLASRDAVHRVLEWYEEIVTSEFLKTLARLRVCKSDLAT